MAIVDSTIIIADDLTGANDTALQYFKKGCSTRIVIDCNYDFCDENNVDIWAVSTESRNIDKTEAVEKVAAVSEKLSKNLNIENFYKKIDSTLRGNTGAEIVALLEISKKDAVIVAPAYIEEGRSTIGGYQLLNGMPIERTQCALDPKAPIYESYIPDILKKDLNSQIASLIDTIELNTVTKGAGPISLKINELIQKGKKILVLDAASNIDLEQIALAIDKCNYDVLPCGSAGLANAINKNIGEDIKSHPIEHIPNIARLIVSGSATQLTYNQIKKLKEANKNIFFVDLKTKDVISELNENIINEICSKLNEGIDVVVHCSDIKDEINYEEAKNDLIDAGIAKCDFPSIITNFLAELTYEINLRSKFILITIGGETSFKCARKINCTYLEILDAIMPAIPLCMDIHGKIVITKSGNFGTNSTLIDILDYFDKLK